MQKRNSGVAAAASGVPPSPSASSQPRSSLRKTPSQGPLSVQEETDDVVFSRDAQELLRRPSFSETLDKVQHSHRGWLKKLASNGRRWNKRYFVVHGHYLSYFKSENTEDKKGLMGALNLWRVESVTLDKNIVVITLAPEIAVSTNSILSRAFSKKAMDNRILLEAKDAVEASKWITTMKITPFQESPKARAKASSDDLVSTDATQLDGDENDDSRSQASSAKTAREESFRVKSLQVLVADDRIYDFFDVSELTETTRLRIGELNPPQYHAQLTVVAESTETAETRKATATFAPGHATSGTIKIVFKDGGEVHIAWERDVEASVEELIRQAMAEDNSSTLVAPIAGGMFIVTLFIIYVVLEFRFSISAVVAAMMSGSAAAMLAAPPVSSSTNSTSASSSHSNAASNHRYLFNTVSFFTTKRLTSGSMSLMEKVAEHVAAKKKGSALGADDVSILADEKPKLEELRKRTAWLRSAQFIEAAIKEGKLDRVQMEWRVEEASEPIAAIQERVCKKYLDHEFRLIRFLRARSLNVEKAEKLARTSLLWRIAVRPDYFVDDMVPPAWLVEYGGAPLFLKSLSDPDHGTETRIQKWWFRDRQGALSMYFRAGGFDWRKVNRKMGDASALMRVGFWALEMGRKDMDYVHLQSNGGTPSYSTMVIDMEQFSLTQQIPLTELIPLARRFFTVLATSYPELLKRVIVVNTPFLFNGIWQAIRPFIPEDVQDKVQIHGRCDVEKHLRPYFADDQIPTYLGGKATGENGDPLCMNRLPPVGPFLSDRGASLLKPK